MAEPRDSRLLHRVIIQNYKSIRECDVTLGPLTFLVGPNGSGKSNFLDALRFVSDALSGSIEQAFRSRGGTAEVCHKRRDLFSYEIGIRLEFLLPSGDAGHYAFSIDTAGNSSAVLREQCSVASISTGGAEHFYKVARGEVTHSSLDVTPAAMGDRLLLASLSGIPAFRPVFDALSGMVFYDLQPQVLRELQPPGPGDVLLRDAANLPSVLDLLASEFPSVKTRVEEYLRGIVPDLVGVVPRSLGPRRTIQFVQRPADSELPAFFYSSSMSDGTLRALAILLALFQVGNGAGPLLIGLEEPETALHPAAAEVLLDSLREAAESRQIVVTSHSPDLLDAGKVSDAEMLAVISSGGATSIGRIDDASRSVLQDGLFAPGELLRMDHLRPGVLPVLTLNPGILFDEPAGTNA
ncbi:MAG TPA: AAA family ATPase [Longimicrobium sp.]|jgi:predicted ATPase|uniref:AAA family ATPase n=1 Tax=Longimicrobium sp. TaxID=2029185 RepID=UPI002EDB01C4